MDESVGTVSAEAAPEALLIAVARHRDRAAFASLFDQFAPRVRAWLIRQGADRAAADELVQECMLAVWRRAETYDPAQATAATWIFTIARNRRIDLFRRERRPELDPDDPALVPEPDLPADRQLDALETAQRLRAAVDGLPAEQRRMVEMAFYDDKPHSAIAAESGLPLGTVKSRLRLALARLRRAVSEE